MFTLIITLIIIVALLLVLVILAQNSKGGGLTSQFGGAGSSQIMGVKRTGDLLEKATWTLAVLLLGLSLSTTLFLDISKEQTTSPILERAREIRTEDAPGLPIGGDQEDVGPFDEE
jgi:preprotein translocase subunit SecG